jgi:hypothetical protein
MPDNSASVRQTRGQQPLQVAQSVPPEPSSRPAALSASASHPVLWEPELRRGSHVQEVNTQLHRLSCHNLQCNQAQRPGSRPHPPPGGGTLARPRMIGIFSGLVGRLFIPFRDCAISKVTDANGNVILVRCKPHASLHTPFIASMLRANNYRCCIMQPPPRHTSAKNPHGDSRLPCTMTTGRGSVHVQAPNGLLSL